MCLLNPRERAPDDRNARRYRPEASTEETLVPAIRPDTLGLVAAAFLPAIR
jgi:hypothetical protein